MATKTTKSKNGLIGNKITYGYGTKIDDNAVPTEVIIKETDDQKLEKEIKQQLDEVICGKTAAESLKLLTELHTKLLKKYKKIKLKKKNLEEHIKKEYKNTKLIYGMIDIVGFTYGSLEILAGRAGAFKPHKVTILCRKKTPEERVESASDKLTFTIPKYINENYSVDITNILVMGAPQTVSWDGATITKNRFNSRFFENGKIVDWMVFGSSAGQGLQFDMFNPHDFVVTTSIIIEGEASDSSLIGTSKYW